VHPVLSSFALALVQKAALVVQWPPRVCDNEADAPEACVGGAAGLDDIFRNPGFDWERPLALCFAVGGDRYKELVRPDPPKAARDKGVRLGLCVSNPSRPNMPPRHLAPIGATYADEYPNALRRADLSAGPWNTTVVVRTWHRFLREVLCNERVAASGLFPPDQLAAQRALEAYLLAPTAGIAAAVARGLEKAGGCAVGLHLRLAGLHGREGDDKTAKRPSDFRCTEADVWPRIRKALAGMDGGLAVAADGRSQGMKAQFVAAARRDSVAIVEPDWAGAAPPRDVAAYAENLVLSRCARLVPMDNKSTFFSVAAIRATGRAAVRDVLACPQRAAQSSLFYGWQQPCLFEPTCPDPSVDFSLRHNQRGY